jgi:hypothetical protein
MELSLGFYKGTSMEMVESGKEQAGRGFNPQMRMRIGLMRIARLN